MSSFSAGRLHPAARWLLVLAAGGCVVPAAAEWAQYEREHFEFRTELRQIVAVDMLRQLEYLHWIAGQYLGVPERSGAKPGRFEILDLGNPARLQAVFDGLGSDVHGLYARCPNGAAAYVVRSSWVLASIRGGISWDETILQHEYLHHLMFSRISGAYPEWFVEGFAEYLSQPYVDGGSLVVGSYNQWRRSEIGRLAPEDLLAWNTLPAAKRKDTTENFYAQSWQGDWLSYSASSSASSARPYHC